MPVLFTVMPAGSRTSCATLPFSAFGGGEMRVRNRRGMLAAGDEPGDVRHVDEQQSADGIGDLPKARKIDDARISGRAGGDHGGADFLGLFLQCVVIDLLGLGADAVL